SWTDIRARLPIRESLGVRLRRWDPHGGRPHSAFAQQAQWAPGVRGCDRDRPRDRVPPAGETARMMRRNASWNLLIALLGLLTFLAGILVAHRSLLAAAALLGAIETARRLVRRYREVRRKESETAELHARIERLEQQRARLEGI